MQTIANYVVNIIYKLWSVGFVCMLAGLAAVGVALVASAAKQLTKGVCKDKVTMVINTGEGMLCFAKTIIDLHRTNSCCFSSSQW